MLTIEQIKQAAQKAALHYPIRKVFLFGSYAAGYADETSDVDMLVEFAAHPISLFELAGFNQELRDELNTSVDTVKLPLKQDSIIDINQAICLYERMGNRNKKHSRIGQAIMRHITRRPINLSTIEIRNKFK